MEDEFEYEEAINFFKNYFRGWMGNLMRDLDAQGMEVPLGMYANALQELADEINEDLHSDVDDFLREQEE